jgi:hypothetical protein
MIIYYRTNRFIGILVFEIYDGIYYSSIWLTYWWFLENYFVDKALDEDSRKLCRCCKYFCS